MSIPFAHLHCHTHYSLLDGAGQIKDLLKRAKDLQQPALAITDHGNMYGVLEFYRTAQELEIKPVVGYEAYIAVTNRFDKTGKTQKAACHHLTLLAMNNTGYRNLIKMSSVAFLEGKHWKPRIDKDLLQEYNEGIICLSGCASGELNRTIFEVPEDGLPATQEEDAIALAAEVAKWYRGVFGDRYYIELQDNGLEIQKYMLAGAVQIARDLNIPTAATNDVHYIYQKDAQAQDILLCVNTGAKRHEQKRMRMDSDNFFMRSSDEMLRALPGNEDAVARTMEIADRCNVELELNNRFFPVFKTPDDSDHNEHLRQWCLAGLKRRYANNPKRLVNGELSADVMERLDRELDVIKELKFTDYFLIVGDFVREAEERGIHRTARGSGVGSLVCFAMNMSHVCPLEYDLLFERFLDPSRPQAPDIDIDFDDDRREELIEYCREKYGRDNVGRLGTFGTMAAKGSVKDVGRALDLPISFVNDITKLIPATPGTKLADVLNGKKNKKTGKLESPPNEELKKRYENEPQVKELVDFAMQVEGLARNTGVHACGVVIADKPLTEYLPLQLTKDDVIVTQWEGPAVEEAGLLKMDFLGLKNLGGLANAIELIKETTGEEIDVYNLPDDDPKVFELFQRGETKGVFQFESGGMREWMIRLKPDNLRDLIALNALYRPGPMDNIPKYIAVKHGKEKAVYAHSILEDVLKETHGVIVYQEQIMRLFNRLGSIPLGEAYDVIKAISKKKEDKIVKYRAKFVDGAKQQGLTAKQAEEIFENIAKFAGYGFNKSHATAYANLAYITAYLKVRYPAQYMAALLSTDIGNKKSLVEHIKDCERMGLAVVPPDVNSSNLKFTVKDGKIVFALTAIARCGDKAIDKIIEVRKDRAFRSIFDFCERVDNKVCNKSTIEALVKAGAFDSLGQSRKTMFNQIEGAVKAGQKAAVSTSKGQKSMFAMLDDEPVSARKRETPFPARNGDEWDNKEKALNEKEVLGFYLSSSPMKEYSEVFRQLRTHTCGEAGFLPDKTPVILAGMVNALVSKPYKNPKPGRPPQWAGFDFEDEFGSVRSIAWGEQFQQYAEHIQNDSIVFAVGRIDRSNSTGEEKDDANFIVDDIYTPDEAAEKFIKGMLIMLNEDLHKQDTVQKLYDTLKALPGTASVELSVQLANGSRASLKDAKVRIAKLVDVYRKAESLLGEGCVRWIKSPPRKEKPDFGYKKAWKKG
ncbi:MAG: DNA polymerase III subunit alpha [Planctomycetaceae bacterium]|jgi:DNA polymerase-3 subunit alpha|nr:DNA polymerase III subunit alpha [Planctomycetaceae bacterium]